MTTKEKFIEMAKNITRPGIDEIVQHGCAHDSCAVP